MLKDINLVVPQGQYLAITGKSGSGKSTLLYQLGLLDHPTSGCITLDTENVCEMSSAARTRFRLTRLGYVFQDYALIPSLTALENVMVPLLMQGLNGNLARDQATEALARVGLEDRINNLPSQLSGGQQQRVSIARAIGHRPSILFADEPTANLDSETSELVLQSFQNLHAQGQTIVMVTHEQEYAKRAQRIITLSDGQIIQDYLV
ncbi:MAG: ABC transporter [Patescibacteria group bacterium]|nr:MAG: ABC transporter [Patescibacteria group bacterium]